MGAAIVYGGLALLLIAVLRMLLSGGRHSSHGGGHGSGHPHSHVGHGAGQTANGQQPQGQQGSQRKRRERRDNRHDDNSAPPVKPIVPRGGFRDSSEEERFEEHCRFSGYEYDRRTQTVREVPQQSGGSGFGGVWGFCQMCVVLGVLLFLFTLLPWN